MKISFRILQIISFCFCTTGLSVAQQNILPNSNYIVVAAYSPNKVSVAQEYTSMLEANGLEAKYGLAEGKNLFFVYLAKIDDFDQAVSEMLKTRQSEQFSDAWVFVNKSGSIQNSGNVAVSEVNAENENTENGASDPSSGVVEKVIEETKESSSSTIISTTDSVAQSSEPSEVVRETEENTAVEPEEITELAQIGFKVNLFNAQTATETNGSVEIIDTERAKRIQKFKSGETQSILNPDNGTGKLSLIVDNFGFRKQQKEINFFNPLADTTQTDISFSEGVYQVNFDLIRYSVGDFVVMYNVAFFKDAAVMRPVSKFEIKSLLEMMNENPDMRIKIHGHVNGKHPGKVISKGEETDYYKLSDLNEEGVGSAKELSKKRAELIKSLLIENGVAENRMEIRAWGGKRMIHDKNSTQADENVRVEIEILED